MHCFNTESRKARKKHTCTYCGDTIHPKELYLHWSNVDDHFFTNKVHFECYGEIKGEYYPYHSERPLHRLTNLGLVLFYERRGWPTSEIENYQRPVIPFGYL